MGKASLHRAWVAGRRVAPDEVVLLALVAGACLYQLALFAESVGLRLATAYPHDWIEGLSLLHAFSMERGWPAYHPPHVESVPPLYTPLLAWLLRPFVASGLGGYPAARAVSVAAIALALVVLVRIARREGSGVAGAGLGVGVFLGTYVAADRVYDMGRVDALALGCFALGLDQATAPGKAGWRGWLAGAWLVGATFAKQSYGLVSLALMVLVALRRPGRAVRAMVAYASLGASLALALEREGGGWFLAWVLRMPSRHPIEWQKGVFALGVDLETAFPAVVLAALALVAAARLWLPTRTGPGGLALPGVAVAALGLCYLQRLKVAGHVNVWTPFFYLAGLLAAAAAADLRRIERRGRPGGLGGAARLARHALLVLAALGVLSRGYRPADGHEGPSADAAVAGVRRFVAAAHGPVLCPVLPELVEMAGGGPQYSIMPVWDMAYAQLGIRVRELPERIRAHHYRAVLLPLDLAPYLEGLDRAYLPVVRLPVPVMTSGNRLAEHWIWLPRDPRHQPGGLALDFELGQAPGWQAEGPAFAEPVARVAVLGRAAEAARGTGLLASGSEESVARGRLASRPFPLMGSGISLLAGGGGQVAVELWCGERLVASVRPPRRDRMERVFLAAGAMRGREVRLVVRDDDEGIGRRILVDDFTVVDAPPGVLEP